MKVLALPMVIEDPQRLRRTKIVCTVGPSSRSSADLQSLQSIGMNVARMNLAHGSRSEHEEQLAVLRDLSSKAHLAVLVDTRGGEVRTGARAEPLSIREGEDVLFAPELIARSKTKSKGTPIITVNYGGFSRDVREAEVILLDNGEMSFEILEIRNDGTVLARAKQAGSIGSRRHINLPGADIDLPSITDHDWEDIAWAATHGVDFIALSFIREAEDIQRVRAKLEELQSDVSLIAKIEHPKAVENIGDIIDAADGVMIARGDLGAEVPFEELPQIQVDITARCIDAGIPVIVATHMLESMIEHPIPTRAEVTDVAHAAETGADATMLSGETSVGEHPRLAVDAMDRILRTTERSMERFGGNQRTAIRDERDAAAERAVTHARKEKSGALIVTTIDGSAALRVSKFRPPSPIVACTNAPAVARKLCLSYGVIPLVVEGNRTTMIEEARRWVHAQRIVDDGAAISVVPELE